MNKKFIYTIITIISVLFIYFFTVNAGTKPDTATDGVKKSHHQHKHAKGEQHLSVVTLTEIEKNKISVKTVSVGNNPIQSFLKVMGKVQASPNGKAIVGYMFPGRIVKLHTSIGRWVEKGGALLTLECEDVGNAKSDYFKAVTEFRLVEQNFQREERLFKKDVGAKKDYLEAKAQLHIARSNKETARKKLLVMGFKEKEVEGFADGKDIDPYITIKASITGRVAENNAVLGAMVEPATEIMLLLNPSTLCIDAEIYEKDLASIQTGQDVRINVPAYPSETFVGQVCYIGDVVHPETRTITVRTHVDNKDFKLKPGMFADINIQVAQRKNAVTVPKDAVLDDLGKKIVFVHKDGRYVCRAVRVGAVYNNMIEIISGLKAGETVVVEGNYQLKSRLYKENLTHSH